MDIYYETLLKYNGIIPRSYNGPRPPPQISIISPSSRRAFQSQIQNLQETINEQSATINKLQQEILELKTMMENVSG